MNGVHPSGLTRLARILRLYRSVNDLGTRDVAIELGISAATLNRIERGHAMDAESFVKAINWLMVRTKGGA